MPAHGVPASIKPGAGIQFVGAGFKPALRTNTSWSRLSLAEMTELK